MAIFKCKMCGGNLELTEGSSVATCEYCGTTQTVPSADNEKKLTLFGRANRLRAACEFDKAFGIYEAIVADFPEEAEAYWGLVLCKYGIEYVDDPKTGKKIPTCHRSSFESVMEDTNFEQVMENSNMYSRVIYRDEAKQIEELRKGIIEISAKEEPYDIFICYKETDEHGERTLDSVLAQDVYDELTEKGYRVFFARITLEDKLGQEYEPYIFAALNSAKVMLVFGSDYEYFNAVWVKNEWSRFLELIAKGEKKTLIPCYKNIDAYDMPREFAKLQAQDMGKVGAIQDLIRGIGKIVPIEKNVKVEVEPTENISQAIEAIMKEREERKEQLEREHREQIERNRKEKREKRNKRIAIITTLIVCAVIAFTIILSTVIIPNGKYNDAVSLMEAGKYSEAISAFEALNGYKDSANKITECNTAILDGKYNDAIALMGAGDIVEAYEAFVALDGYKDSTDKANSIYDKYKKLMKLKTAKIGDYVSFGAYEQDNKISNGKETIEWLVLEVKDGKVLVISKYALDCKSYHTSYTDVTWETCTLRKWLNNDFINAAFSTDEKAMIPTVTVSADNNPEYSTNPGNATQDQVFLLSITEVNKYFSSDSARKCKPTNYAGTYTDIWWLRSPGARQNNVAAVNPVGGVVVNGSLVALGNPSGVRPAMWIDLSSFK